MVLKANPHQRALIEEQVKGVIHDNSYSQADKEAARDLLKQLKQTSS